MFEKRIFLRMFKFIVNVFSKYPCDFEKGYTQQKFLAILEKLKKYVNNGKGCGAVIVDLSKASFCLDYELLIAKLKTFSLATSY